MRPLRSLAHTVLALTTGLGLALAGATGAQAAPSPGPTPASSESCSIIVPAQVVVEQRTVSMPVSLGIDCPMGSVASWNLVAPGGRTLDTVELSSGESDTVRLARQAPLGTYTFVPVTAADAEYDQLVQNTAAVNVGARTTTATKVTGSRHAVRVAAAVSTYDRSRARALPRAGATVRLQRSTCASGCPWVDVSTAKTDRRGTATVSMRPTRPARTTYLRVYTDGTATAWGSIGKAFRL